MEQKKRRFAVLTGGGDCPGLNAVIRAVVKTFLQNDCEVYGVLNGFNGLINDNLKLMDYAAVSGILPRGGTILGTTNRDNPFHFAVEENGELVYKDMREKVVENLRKYDIEALVVIGGDGSFRGAADLSKAGIPCVGLPGTIDNDIQCSEYTIGYDTAMNTVMELVDKLRDTSHSHERCAVVEVMGRGAGHIALNTGVACGATAILVPEIEFNMEDVVRKIRTARENGKEQFIVIVAEGVGHTEEIAKKIYEETGIESRATILGHVQRGGSPTVRDRVVASEMGYYAVELLEKGIGNRVVGMKDGKIYDVDIQEALSMKKPFDKRLYDIANEISF